MVKIIDSTGKSLTLSDSNVYIEELGMTLAEARKQNKFDIPDSVRVEIDNLKEGLAAANDSDAHIHSVVVTVNSDSGTPAGTATYSKGTLTLSLVNLKGDKGDEGKSAYDVYVASVAEGTTPMTEEEWLASLKGDKGDEGKSAYDVYVASVPIGEAPLTEEAWLASLKGEKGDTGASAYDAYVASVAEGTTPMTEQEWLASLKGEKGDALTYDQLTDEQKAELKGKDGEDGSITNLASSVSATDTTNAVNGKAVADYVSAHAGANVVAGTNVTITTNSDGSKTINASLPSGTATDASAVSFTESDGTQTTLQTKVTELDGKSNGHITNVAIDEFENGMYIVDSSYNISKSAVDGWIRTKFTATDDAIYLVSMPSTMGCALNIDNKFNSFRSNRVTSGCFSFSACNGSVGLSFYNKNIDELTTPEVITDFGEWVLGSCGGGGGDRESTSYMRCAKYTLFGKFKVEFDDSKVNVIINTSNGKASHSNQNAVNGALYSETCGFIRFLIQNLDGTVDDSTPTNANIKVTVVAKPSYTLSTSTLTDDDKSMISVKKLIPSKHDYFDVVVAANDSSQFDKDKADIVCDGTDDTDVLQCLFGCYNSINVLLMGGKYKINSIHYIEQSKEYACLSTFDDSVNIASVGNGLNKVSRTVRLVGAMNDTPSVVGNAHLLIGEDVENSITSDYLYSALLIPNKGDSGYTNSTLVYTSVSLKGLRVTSTNSIYDKNFIFVNLWGGARSNIEDMSVYGSGENGEAEVFPSTYILNSNSVGIRVGQGSNNGSHNYVKNCRVMNCAKGFSCGGEHYVFEDCLAHHCWYGFAFGDFSTQNRFEHPNLMLGCSIEACHTLMYLTKDGITSSSTYDEAANYSKNVVKSTLVCYALSTEKTWASGTSYQAETEGIEEVIDGIYRGDICGDGVTVKSGCSNLSITNYIK